MKNLKTILILALVMAFALMPVMPGFAETFRQGGDRFTFNPSAISTKTSAYTVTSSDSLINVTCSSADIVITLPTVSSSRANGTKAYKILKTDSTDYSVVITPATGDTIGGESTRYLNYANAYVVISTGAGNDWEIDFESPYLVEDYEAGTVTLNAPITQFGDQAITGTTPQLTIGDGGAEDTTLLFDTNPVNADMHIGYDDSADLLRIGVGTALGTDHRISIANTLDSTTILIGDAATEDSQIRFDGNAQDFHIGLDDSADDLVIGLGSALGTTPAISIDENQVVTLYQDPIFGGTTPTLTIGDAGAEDTAVVFDGNAQDFYVGLDDTADDLVFGVGSALGTTQALGIDENRVVTIAAAIMYPAETTTATNVLTVNECGKIIWLNSATEFATTLPAMSTVSAGCTFEFIVTNGGAPSGAAYTVITGNSLENVIVGGIVERETDTGDDGPSVLNGAEGDTITFADGIAKEGDWAKVTSDGTYWYLTGVSNSDGGVVPSQAD